MFYMSIRQKVLEELRKKYSKGTRVWLIRMMDPYRDMPEGLEGTVQSVDDTGSLQAKRDNGSSLAVLHGIDKVEPV